MLQTCLDGFAMTTQYIVQLASMLLCDFFKCLFEGRTWLEMSIQVERQIFSLNLKFVLLQQIAKTVV